MECEEDGREEKEEVLGECENTLKKNVKEKKH